MPRVPSVLRSIPESQLFTGMFKLKRISQFIRFCAVGGIVAAIDLTTVWITSHFLPALVAVSLGYSTEATVQFAGVLAVCAAGYPPEGFAIEAKSPTRAGARDETDIGRVRLQKLLMITAG